MRRHLPAWADLASPWGPPWHELIEHEAWFRVHPTAPPFTEAGELRYRVLRRRPAQIPRVLRAPEDSQPLGSELARLMDRGPAELRARLESGSERELHAALEPDSGQDLLERACCLLSPLADAHRPLLCARAHALTRARFHGRLRLYAPLYLSNHCHNACRYCYFTIDQRTSRVALDAPALEREAAALAQTGISEVLLLSGDARREFGVAELASATTSARAYFTRVGLEVFPLEVEEYAALRAAGARSVTVYQETYDAECYARVHRAGRKRDMLWRLGALERAAAGGFRELGLGALLGLSDFRYEGVALALHAAALQELFPGAALALSFPRLRQGPAGYLPPRPVSDGELEHLMAALRLLLPDAQFLLSTREPPALRDRLAELFGTRMSAGSVTRPGGYSSVCAGGVAQFESHDRRAPREVRAQLRELGIDVR